MTRDLRIGIVYYDGDVKVNVSDIVATIRDQNETITDDIIKETITEFIDDAIVDGPWPSYRIEEGGKEELFDAIKEALQNADE